MQIILASQSPRRRELLARLGLSFEVRAADVDETMDEAQPPFDEVARLSARKAAAIPAGPDDVVVAADTIVTLGGRVLGKPRDAEEACRMLLDLSGREHRVMTGVTVRRGEQVWTETVVTRVRFRPMDRAEVEAYVATGDPLDKAGSYGVQGPAAVFVEGLDGDYYNVVGLPLCKLCDMLRAAGVRILGL